MGYSRIWKTVRAAAVLLISVTGTVAADCVDPTDEPYKGDVKVMCRIDWDNSGYEESAFFAPIDNDTWVAWIHGARYYMEPVLMNVTSNSCEGLAMIGPRAPYLYRVIIVAENPKVIAQLDHDDPDQADSGAGKCRVLDEEEYKLAVRIREVD